MILITKKYIKLATVITVLLMCLVRVNAQHNKAPCSHSQHHKTSSSEIEQTQFNTNAKEVNFELQNVRLVSSGEEFSMPVWSPDDNKLLIATAHGTKLKMIELDASNRITEISNARGSGYNASWSLDGNQVFFRYKESGQQTYVISKSFDLGNGKIKNAKLNPNGLRSASKAVKNDDPEIFVNLENLKVEAQTKDKTASWEITDFDGQFYHPLLSPDKKQVIVHEKSDMYLYATDGSGLIKHLGTGIASSWSPDGKYVLAFLDSSIDGHVISGSELYLIDIELGKLVQFTNTDKVNEMWPAWSNDGSKIAFEDERSGNILIADMVKK